LSKQKQEDITMRGGATAAGGAMGCFLIILILNITIGGVATQYVVEHWASYIQHTPVHVPFLPCAIAGLFLGEVTVPAAIVTWILTFCIMGL